MSDSKVLSLVRRRDDDVAQPAHVSPPPSDRYTVLLLDEEQLDRLLQRQGVRTLAAPPVSTVVTTIGGASRRSVPWAAVAGLAVGVVVALGVAGWFWRPVSEAASVEQVAGQPIAAPVPDTAPVVSTGASFSVDVASFVADGPAQAAAERLAAAGWPAFTWRLDEGRRHLLVGPYVSIDEAETAQRQLARSGHPVSRLHVDDRLRVTPAALGTTRRKPQYPDLVLVAAPGRLSYVFELAEEPRHVSGQRVGATSFVMTAGPLATPVENQVWKAPGDVRLVNRVALSQRTQDPTALQAVVTLAETADASVRLQGRRVYIDVFRRVDEVTPLDDQPEVGPRPPRSSPRPTGGAPPAPGTGARGAEAVPPVGSAGGDPSVAAYRSAVQPYVARFEEIQPFLRSAVGAATPDVLAALSGTCMELEQALAGVVPPPAARATHGFLLSAVQVARTATAPSFRDDRVAMIREASAQFSAAKARLQDLTR